MKNLNLFSKIFLYLAVLSGVFWLGSYVAKLVMIYQLFQGPYFQLNYYITSQNLPGILASINPLLLSSDILFVVFILTYFVFLIFSGISLKNNGWLFIISVLILLMIPFEVYLITVDYRIYNLSIISGFNAASVLDLYIHRMKVLGSFPLIELFCYAGIIFFALFQPLMKKNIS